MHKKRIMASIEGIVTPLQRKLLVRVLEYIDDLSKRISMLDAMIKNYMMEYETAISAIDELPDIGRCSAEVVLAGISTPCYGGVFITKRALCAS